MPAKWEIEMEKLYVVTPQTKHARMSDKHWKNQASVVKQDRAAVDRYLLSQRSYFKNARDLDRGYQTRYHVREVQVLSEEFVNE